jgi:hypothetical protein
MGFRNGEDLERYTLETAGRGSSGRSSGLNFNETTSTQVHVARRSDDVICECYGWDRADRPDEITTFDTGLCGMREARTSKSWHETFDGMQTSKDIVA